MAAHPENFIIEEGVLTWVSAYYIKKNNGYFEIPSSVKTISEHAFLTYPYLKQVTIPDSVRNIDPCAFLTFSKLKKVTISDSVATIGYDAFGCCHKDLEITIITSDQSGEKAQELKAKLKKDYPYVPIHIEPPLSYDMKGDSSSPSFFSPPSEQEDGEPSSNNQNQPGA